jgi:urease subunit alpha
MVCHHLNAAIPEDLAFAESRIRAETIAAEDVLHDLGAISMMASDSQAMGRIGEVIIRTWQTADKMKRQRGPLPGETAGDDNRRVKRYVAKYTINPALAHGLADHVGSVEVGKLADLVVWKPAFFGVKPELVLKGGSAAWAPLGEGNATVERAEPTRFAPDWAGTAHAAPDVSLTFVSGAADVTALARRLGTRRRLVTVRGCRGLTRGDLRWNRATAPVEVSVTDGSVTLDGRILAVEPAADLPLNRRYFLR